MSGSGNSTDDIEKMRKAFGEFESELIQNQIHEIQVEQNSLALESLFNIITNPNVDENLRMELKMVLNKFKVRK